MEKTARFTGILKGGWEHMKTPRRKITASGITISFVVGVPVIYTRLMKE